MWRNHFWRPFINIDQKRDPTKASASINELRFHFSTTDWKGIQILENHYELTNTTANGLIEEAWTLLKLVKETNNQAMLGIALQVNTRSYYVFLNHCCADIP